MKTNEYLVLASRLKQQLLLPELEDALRDSQRTNVAGPADITENAHEQLVALLMRASVGYALYCASEEGAKLATGYGLFYYFEPIAFGKLMAHVGGTRSRHEIFKNQLVRDFYTTIRNTLTHISIQAQLLQKHFEPSGSGTWDLLRFNLVSDPRGVALEELQRIVHDLVRLFEQTNRLTLTPEETLAPRVVWSDSGSDIVLAILAAGKSVSYIKVVVADLWDKWRYRTNELFERDIDTLHKSLTAIERLHQLEKSADLSSNETAKLRQVVVARTVDLLRRGVIPEEIIQAPPNALPDRQILIAAREQLLIEGPVAQSASDDDREPSA